MSNRNINLAIYNGKKANYSGEILTEYPFPRSNGFSATFGKVGYAYYGYVRGIDEREMEPNQIHKSLGAETTFAEDTNDRKQLYWICLPCVKRSETV